MNSQWKKGLEVLEYRHCTLPNAIKTLLSQQAMEGRNEISYSIMWSHARNLTQPIVKFPDDVTQITQVKGFTRRLELLIDDFLDIEVTVKGLQLLHLLVHDRHVINSVLDTKLNGAVRESEKALYLLPTYMNK